VREPRPSLALVRAKALEPCLNIVRESCGMPTGIVEDEHPDAARLAIPQRREPNLPSARRGVPQGPDDRVELVRRPMSEKRERDM
jgi:hypothetical protein